MDGLFAQHLLARARLREPVSRKSAEVTQHPHLSLLRVLDDGHLVALGRLKQHPNDAWSRQGADRGAALADRFAARD